MLNILNLNTSDGIRTYRSLLTSLDLINPYCLPEYFDVFCGGLENLICFTFTSKVSNSSILMPGYLKSIILGEIQTGYYDFKTPYGYTGPTFSLDVKKSDVEEFWKAVDNWYRENNVITEFIRFNLSGNQIYYSGSVFPTMLNIKGKIIDIEEQWKSFDAKVRKNVNRAKKENLSCKVYHKIFERDKIVEFYDIYIETMKRTNAKESFFYSLESFEDFILKNEEYVSICTIYFDQIAVSSELLLVSNDSIYSFLGGTDERYFDKRPNDFLKVEALNWARIEGKKYYILGGGYGFEDGIFKYKKSFFPNDVVNYCTGRKIINEDVYNELIDKTSLERISLGLEKLDKNDTSFFPLYNKLN
ncbi:GNAT family N-acetyltransferase [Flavobacterium sp.]|uniref:GNAT family N-acetyltransferase n=1 Tax=Flavobacterium sp. TaxID=239 RepID=UPI002ED9C9B5